MSYHDSDIVTRKLPDQGKILHEYLYYPLVFRLTEKGKLMVFNHRTNTETEQPWYSDTDTKKPWLVRKRKSFVSLIKGAIREGDYNDL